MSPNCRSRGSPPPRGDGKLPDAALGIGSFFALFWAGVVVTCDLGLHPISILVVGLLATNAGASPVAQLERHDGGI